MNHVDHIRLHKRQLELRSLIIRSIRAFFEGDDFLEVEAPMVLRVPGQEPYLDPVPVTICNERENNVSGYLHTSPEYTMKKMLAAGFERIFYLGKCFRDKESFGGMHNPEFTLLEWYRAGADFTLLMDDVEELFGFVARGIREDWKLEIADFRDWKRMSMCDLWVEIIDVDLDEYLTDDAMKQLCKERGFVVETDERYEDWFFKIFLNEIEPRLADMGNVIVHHYPAQMAALALLSTTDPRYAERFEVYVNGVEIANAFSELTDRVEQQQRLEDERVLRRDLGKAVYDLDEEFLLAVEQMPPSAGIALGVDRFVMAFLGCKEIDDVLVLPMSKLMVDT